MRNRQPHVGDDGMHEAHARKFRWLTQLDRQMSGEHQVLRCGRAVAEKERHLVAALTEADESLYVVFPDGDRIDLETAIDAKHVHEGPSRFPCEFPPSFAIGSGRPKCAPRAPISRTLCAGTTAASCRDNTDRLWQSKMRSVLLRAEGFLPKG